MALTVTEILAPVGQGASPATILTATFSGSANVGDYVFVTVVLGSTGTLPTPTDSAGNVYSLDQQDASTSASMRHGIAFCRVTKPIVAGVTTISITTAAIEKGMSAVVVQSPGLVLELDKTNRLSNNVTGTALTTGASGTLVTPLELAIATYAWGNTTSTFSETGGWTNPHGAGVRIQCTSTVFEAATQYLLPTTTTSLNPTATLGTSDPWGGSIVTYRILNAYAPPPFRIPNPNVGPMALRRRFRRITPSAAAAQATSTQQTVTLSGTVAPTGALSNQGQKTLAGGATPAGVLVRQTQKALTGTAAPTGALVKSVGKLLTGTVTAAGTFLSQSVKLLSLSGAVTPVGTLVKRPAKLVAGTVSPSGALIRLTTKLVAGAVTPTGALVKSAAKALTGAVSPAGSLAARGVKLLLLSGVVTPTGTLTRQTQKALAGTVTTTGTLRKATIRFLSGAVIATGTLSKQMRKALAGTVAATGSLLAQITATALAVATKLTRSRPGSGLTRRGGTGSGLTGSSPSDGHTRTDPATGRTSADGGDSDTRSDLGGS